jgi:hypothetical protein
MSKSTFATLANLATRAALAALAALATLGGAAVYAAGLGLKPGLWEIKVVKSVVDGQDHTPAVTGLGDRMQQFMASLPPDQRAQMEARLKQSGVSMSGGAATIRICVSAAMAKRDTPIVDKSGRCQPASVTHSGNQTTYAFNCSVDGRTTTGQGTATSDGEVIRTHVAMSIQEANGPSHVIENDSTMTFVGADCGDVQPPDDGPPT